MEEARKKLRICLLLVVTAAVIVGCVYYFNDARRQQDMRSGTFVNAPICDYQSVGAMAGRRTVRTIPMTRICDDWSMGMMAGRTIPMTRTCDDWLAGTLAGRA